MCHHGLYFVATDDRGASLWTSDGTRGDEERLVALPGSAERPPTELRCLTDGVALIADDGQHGREVWTWRRGSAGPVLHDIRPGEVSSRPFAPRVMDGRLFLVANDGVHGRELWTVGLD